MKPPKSVKPTTLLVSRASFLGSPKEWLIIVIVGLVIAALAFPWYADISLWIGVTILVLAVVMGHATIVMHHVPPLPHVVLAFASLQMVFMAWFALYHPPIDPVFSVGARTAEYLTYGAPAWIAYAFGWLSGLWKLGAVVEHAAQHPSGGEPMGLLRELDILLFGGILIGIVQNYVQIQGLDFVLLLLANLKFIGAFGWILMRQVGWRWRIALILGLEIITSAGGAMFGGLVLWAASALALCLYSFRSKRATFLLSLAAMFVMLPALEQAKLRLRGQTWSEASSPEIVLGLTVQVSDTNRPLIWSLYLVEALWKTVTFSVSEDDLSALSSRHNHGWIVDRVLLRVPSEEPYAMGETLVTALASAVVPRVLVPDKYFAGGVLFERFTGQALHHPSTGARLASMNLGFAGELYANFGHTGGIVSCGIWGLVCGLIMRWFYLRSLTSRLWWAFLPYVLVYAMKAEEGMGEILNWFVKSAMISIMALYCLPGLRMALWGNHSLMMNRNYHLRW